MKQKRMLPGIQNKCPRPGVGDMIKPSSKLRNAGSFSSSMKLRARLKVFESAEFREKMRLI